MTDNLKSDILAQNDLTINIFRMFDFDKGTQRQKNLPQNGVLYFEYIVFICKD